MNVSIVSLFVLSNEYVPVSEENFISTLLERSSLVFWSMQRGLSRLKLTYRPFSIFLTSLVGIGAGVYWFGVIVGGGVGDL